MTKTNLAYLNHQVVPLDDWPPAKRDDIPPDPAVDFYIYSVKKARWSRAKNNGITGVLRDCVEAEYGRWPRSRAS